QSSMSTSLSGSETGLVGYWNFNEGSGTTLADQTSNGNNGTINGATWSTDVAVFGCTDPYAENYNSNANVDDGSCAGYPSDGEHSLSFDGVDDYVEFGNSGPVGTSARTFQFKIKLNDLNQIAPIITYGKNQVGNWGELFYVALKEVNNDLGWGLHVYNKSSWCAFTEIIFDDEFHDYALVMPENGTLLDLTLYQDGQIYFPNQSDHGIPYTWDINTADEGFMWIGTNYFPYFASANFSQFAIWDIALSQEQVDLYIGNHPSIQTEGLVGYWKFNAGEGDILYDHSGNANHGTI
ncbi:uncharacterized protein METZ01_LOCUS385749, partial [marine metagenome]